MSVASGEQNHRTHTQSSAIYLVQPVGPLAKSLSTRFEAFHKRRHEIK
jgi:hypothetical protein